LIAHASLTFRDEQADDFAGSFADADFCADGIVAANNSVRTVFRSRTPPRLNANRRR